MTNKISGVLLDAYGTVVIKTGAKPKALELMGMANRSGLFYSDKEIARALPQLAAWVTERKTQEDGFAREEARQSKIFFFEYYAQLLRFLGCTGDLKLLARRMFDEYIMDDAWQVDPQAWDLLRFLANRRIALGIVSNGTGQVRHALRNFGLTSWIRTVVISEEEEIEKPDPRIFHLAMARLGPRANESVFVGDLPEADMAGALAAGMRGVLIDRRDKYPNPGVPCLRIKQLSELPGVLGL